MLGCCFFLGQPPNNSDSQLQARIDNEARVFGDIVQESFEDVYHNIRLKAVAMLKWASTFCQQAKYVIRTDDDVDVIFPKLVDALERQSATHEHFILGRTNVNRIPIRSRNVANGKYYVSYDEYPEKTYPPFAFGGLLGYPLSTVKLLYLAALRLRPVWLDDVFITGICAHKLNINLLSDPSFTFAHLDNHSQAQSKIQSQKRT
ncbi:beta-1,3-galactosyltransferase 1-like [Physella acuta]|uniref:beta-1,3-galactosyltransferase 1-like n=1 Tax=Physella acuta TaxID=109671 RepID=UPI0027DB5D37|nr:beta-1,3-galactosyltransferase 1-like [Physella acuta]